MPVDAEELEGRHFQAVSEVETMYLPESNETIMRVYGFNGELIGEHIMAAELGQSDIPRFWREYGGIWYDRETGTLEWSMTGRPTNYRILDEDISEWDREQDAHHSIYRQEYPQHNLLGKWDTAKEEPDIQDERGGALDKFLDVFKPQKPNQKEVMNKSEC